MSPFVRRPTVRHTDRILARSIFLIVFAIYAASFVGIPENSDGEIEFQTTSALARTGSFALGGTAEAKEIKRLTQDLPPGHSPVRYVERGGERVAYAWFGTGQALLGVPFYFAGRALDLVWPGLEARHREVGFFGRPASEYAAHIAVGLRNPFFGALTAFLVVLCCRRLGAARTHAWLAGLAYALTSFAWPQARSSLSDVQATFFLLYSFHWVLRIRERFDRLDQPRRREFFGLGAAAGLASLTRVALVPAAFWILMCGLIVVVQGQRRISKSRWQPGGARSKTRAGYALVLVPYALLLAFGAWANYARFGSALDTGYGPVLTGPAGTFFSGSVLEGLAGLVFAPGRGLLWFAPLVVVAPWGVRQVRASGDWLYPLVLVGVGTAVVLPVAFSPGWHGAWTYGPRYLLPLLPLLWIGSGLALGTSVTATLPRRLAVGGLCVLGLLTQLPAALVDHTTHQDLALQATRQVLATGPEETERAAEERRFKHVLWDSAYAAPWAHWRILRHRVAGLDERYSTRELYNAKPEGFVSPSSPRWMGFSHLWWIDWRDRLGYSVWPAVLVLGAISLLGVILAFRALDRSAP